MKILISFVLFGLFSGTNRLIVKVQVATAEVSTTFSKPSLLRVSCYNFRRNSFQTHVISALVLFFTLFNYCFDFALVFRCHNQRIEKMDLISRRRTLCWIFSKKKNQNKIKYSRSSPDPNFLGVTIRSHIISFRSFQFSRHLWATQENQNPSIQSRKISCNWAKNFRLSQKERFLHPIEKSSYVYSTILGDDKDLYISWNILIYE